MTNPSPQEELKDYFIGALRAAEADKSSFKGDVERWISVTADCLVDIARQREQRLVAEARIEGAQHYNRVLTNNLGKPTYMTDEYGMGTVYEQQRVSAAIQKANTETITAQLGSNPTEKGGEG